MIFILGNDTRSEVIGPTQSEYCHNCRNTDHWVLGVHSTKLTLFWAPLMSMSDTYVRFCPVCKEEHRITKEEFEYWAPLAELNQMAINNEISEEEYNYRFEQIQNSGFHR